MNFIMEKKVGIRAEEADLDVGPGDKLLGIGMKEEDCGAFQIMPFEEMKFFQKPGIRLLQDFWSEAFAPKSTLAEGRE